MENTVTFKITGYRAMFTDPVSKVGGEKYSYQVPTYQSLKGIIESIYWKPTIVWYIDEVRIMKPIRYESVNMRPINYSGGNDLSIYTYLHDVEYHVKAHFEWNLLRPDLENDRNENKHYFQTKRWIEKGGKRDVFLGTRECQADVEPCEFDDSEGPYDSLESMPLGMMFHGFDYIDEGSLDGLQARFWRPVMEKGIIKFIRPEECTIKKKIRDYSAKTIPLGKEEDI